MPRLSWKQAIAWHVHRQHLDRRLPRGKLLTVASELCGLHAQVMSSAELTALCRIEGLRRDDIPRLLWTERKLIKTWAMRSTLHLLPAEEYGRWMHAFADYKALHRPSWFNYFGITPDELDRIALAVGEATRGRMVTREQLADEVVRLTGLPNVREKMMHSWGSLLKPACYGGQLCFGPSKGQNAQFTHPEIAPDPAGGQGFVARKYFSVYGPATAREFSRWLQFGSRRARELMAELGEELAEVDIEGMPAWMLGRDVRAALRAEPVKTVRLLPAFDQYVFAAGMRSARVLPSDGYHSRVYKTQGWFAPVLLVDGRMEGVWKFVRRATRVEVTVEPFAGVSARVKQAAEEEAARVADYLGKPLELKWEG
jgi:hypothetical protein